MLGATHTLLVLTSHTLARIDFAGSRRRLRVQQVGLCPSPATASLTSSIAMAWQTLATSTRNRFTRAPRVWIASADLFSDVLQLPVDTALLLDNDELQQALAMEAESLSGLSAFAAKLRSAKLVDTSSNSMEEPAWWVAQVGDADLETMRAIVHRLGGEFQGATHPAMLQLLASGNQVDRSHVTTALAAWSADTPQVQDESTYRQSIDALATAFINVNQQGRWNACGLGMAESRSASNQLAWMQTAAAITAVLVCGAHYRQQALTLNALTRQALPNSQAVNQDKSIKQDLQLSEGRVKLLRAQVAEQTSRYQQLEKSRLVSAMPQVPNARAWGVMIECLSQETSDAWWLESLDGDAKSVTLYGWSADTRAVTLLASRLGQALSECECEVQVPTLVQQDNVLRFEIKVSFSAIDNVSTKVTLRSWTSQRSGRFCSWTRQRSVDGNEDTLHAVACSYGLGCCRRSNV